jgi:divalent metal cation (Fe/Co/Zn/Cd) transporter
VAVLSIAIKGSLYHITMKTGLNLGSPAVITAAREYLSCIACSSSAAIAILGARLGFPAADPIAGLLVAGFVIAVGIRTIRSSLRDLMDASLPAAEVSAIRQAAESVDGVRRVSTVRTRRHGSRRLVDLAIALDPDLLVEEADRVAEEVRSLVGGHLESADRVTVSIAPADRSTRRGEEMKAAIGTMVRNHAGEFLSFQGPRITRLGRNLCAVLTIVTPSTTSMDQAYTLSLALEREIQLRYPDVEMIIRFRTT